MKPSDITLQIYLNERGFLNTAQVSVLLQVYWKSILQLHQYFLFVEKSSINVMKGTWHVTAWQKGEKLMEMDPNKKDYCTLWIQTQTEKVRLTP